MGMRYNHDFVSALSTILRASDWKITLGYTVGHDIVYISPADIERDYKIGDDMVLMQVPSERFGNFQGLYVPRRDNSYEDVEWESSSLAGKFHFAVASGLTGVPLDPREAHGENEVAANEWHHVVGTYDGANNRLYVDGVEDTGSPGVHSGKIDINGEPVYIGENGQRMGREWNGLIDDVRIYSYALTEAEVKEVYAGRGPGPNERPK